jgi:bifunctional non-homologous end joining protein LigD
LLFVLQHHESQHPHYDFRLERGGRLVSWALPKGLPAHVDERKLAVRVPDHELSFATFEGEIPAGQYGAGTIRIVDSGTYDCELWTERRIVVRLYGRSGSVVLAMVPFKHGKPREWLAIRVS